MIKNADILNEWRRKHLRREPPDYARNLQLFEAMYDEALALNILPLRDPLEGLDIKIKMARDLNVSRAPQKTG